MIEFTKLCILYIVFAGIISCNADNRHQDTNLYDEKDTDVEFRITSDSNNTKIVQTKNTQTSHGRQLRIISARCDYQLLNQAGNNYHPRNMADNNPATAWAAKLSTINDEYHNGIIVGPVFDIESTSKISGVELQNGYCKNSSSFNNNTRAIWITVYRYHPELDGECGEDQMMGYIDRSDIIYEGPIKDSMEPQYFPVNSGFDNSRPTRAVGLLFKQGHFAKGAKWNDLCMSEIRIYGQ